MKQLERVLGLRDVVLLVIGAVIGSGIFIVPATVLRQTDGLVGLALLVWLLAGVLSFLGALTYGELGAMYPEAGGLYVFIRESFGRFFAFLYGWTLFFVIAAGSIATLGVAFTGYLGQFLALPPLAGKATAILMIALVGWINVVGTRRSATVQNWTTALKLSALLIMGVVLVAVGDGGGAGGGAAWPERISGSLLSGVGLAMIGVLWAYEGWQFVTFSVGEVRDPQRTFPLGIAAGTAVLVFAYCLAVIGYVSALGPEQAMQSDSIASTAMGTVFGPAAARLIALAILISIFSAANAVVLTATRVFFAMARDGVFFQALARLHPVFGTPAPSIIATCVWAAVLAASGTFEQLLTYVVFTGWIFYALAGASLLVLRKTRPEVPRPFRVPGYPLTPILFVLSGAAIVLNALFTQPGRALIGIGVVLLGAPAYLIWRRRPGGGPPSGVELDVPPEHARVRPG